MPWTATNYLVQADAASRMTIHGLDPVTRRPYTYTIPDAQEGNMTTDLAIRFTQEKGKVVATLISADANGLAISVEKADPQSAAAELVKAYFTLNPLQAPPQPATLPPRVGRVAVTEIGIQKLLQTAVNQGRKAEIDYRDAEGARSTRHIEPTDIDSRRQLVFATDLDKQEFRTFRLDRIERAEAL